jgi:hypothetical protein
VHKGLSEHEPGTVTPCRRPGRRHIHIRVLVSARRLIGNIYHDGSTLNRVAKAQGQTWRAFPATRTHRHMLTGIGKIYYDGSPDRLGARARPGRNGPRLRATSPPSLDASRLGLGDARAPVTVTVSGPQFQGHAGPADSLNLTGPCARSAVPEPALPPSRAPPTCSAPTRGAVPSRAWPARAADSDARVACVCVCV